MDYKNTPTDMTELAQALDAAGIEYERRPHPGASDELKACMGYNPPVGETIQTIAAISYVALQLLVWLGIL